MKGIGTSSGIALGKVLIYEEPKITVEENKAKDIDREIARLNKAIGRAVEEIQQLYVRTLENVGKTKRRYLMPIR